jgi:AraC-like DNA-binding protein
MTFRSASALSHAFKRWTGRGLKRYQTELRLKTADELLASEPGLTIAEIARRLGYADPLYFSRLYRRHRGRAPSTVRRKR